MINKLTQTLIVVAVSLINTVNAQVEQLTIEDAILGQWSKYRPESYRQIDWIPGTSDFYYITSEGEAVYRKNATQGDRTVVITLPDFINLLPENSNLKQFPKLNWTNSDVFWYTENGGVYYYTDENGSPTIVKVNEYRSIAQNTDIHNRSTSVAYTLGNDLHVTDDKGDTRTFAANAIGEDVVIGQPVHRFEFGINKGTFWNADGTKLAFYVNNQSEVTDYPFLNIDSRPGKLVTSKYPMAGQSSESVNLVVYDLKKNDTVWLKLGNTKNRYFSSVTWGPRSEFIYLAEMNREQNQLELKQFNVKDGKFVATLFEERDDKYLSPAHPLYFVGKNFLWVSNQDGYNNFFYYSRGGQLLAQIATNDIIVDEFLGQSKDGDRLYFAGIPKNSIDRHLYEVILDGNNKGKNRDDESARITKKGFPVIQLTKEPGYHRAKLSPSGDFLIDSYSSIDQPYTVQLINTRTRKSEALLESDDPFKEVALRKPEIGNITLTTGEKLFTRTIKPFDFDPSKKYPVLLYVYNGPNVQLIQNRWLGAAPLWMYHFANKGYIVYTIDGRGSGNRGKDFEQATYRNLGKLEMQDQVTGLKKLMKEPYIDTSKIAVHGWSYGGFMTLSLAGNYPKLFDVAVAGGPVTDWSLYEVMYTERYMATPETNEAGFNRTSVLPLVPNFKSKVLVIHGADDDVVVPQHSLELLKTAVDHDIDIDFFMYPGHKHNVRGKDRVHLMKKVLNYVERNLN